LVSGAGDAGGTVPSGSRRANTLSCCADSVCIAAALLSDDASCSIVGQIVADVVGDNFVGTTARLAGRTIPHEAGVASARHRGCS